MTTTKLIQAHEKCIEILDAIDTFERKMDHAIWDIEFGFIREFPKLVKEYKHRIEIYQMCIDRLNLRYKTLRDGF
jgi:hypothetical protein